MDKTRRNGQNAIYGNEKGFTLVELIVVLVILAILAAILVPALLGWIDKARKQQDMIYARNLVTAAQAKLTERYANRPDKYGDFGVLTDPGVDHANEGTNNDIDAVKTQFAKELLEMADEKPYIFIIGMGSTGIYKDDKDKHKLYTVYLAMYMRTADSTPIYFYGDEWGELYPTDKRIKAIVGGGKNKNHLEAFNVDLQYYVIANEPNWGVAADIWNNLKTKSGWIQQ